ncbi:MAG: hypothetical protein EXS36_05235 [Pedosphaera sp.]|nr:hypothetical protein [Pedosphaera sp.]
MVDGILDNSSAARELLQRSLDRGRLGHAYLFTGDDLELLEREAVSLARTVNCQEPPRRGASGLALEYCGRCSPCRRIASRQHPDMFWIRPESKMRQIQADQTRALTQALSLKAHEAAHKIGILVAAERMNSSAANAFLKTLEEPPAGSILILLSTEPDRLLETVLSRCLRLGFGGGNNAFSEVVLQWVEFFSTAAASSPGGFLSRYRILARLANTLATTREGLQKSMEEHSPLVRYPDAEPAQRERWEMELNAAVESEYRRKRGELLSGIHWWLRDLWLVVQGTPPELLRFPEYHSSTQRVAERLQPAAAGQNLDAWESTQQILHTNVQEALALEVGLLKLKL